MFDYLVRRLLLMIPTLAGIIVISFCIVRLAPGDPASQKFGGAAQGNAGVDAQRGTENAEKRFREKYQLDAPLPIQFWVFLKRLTQLDMISFQDEKPIWGEMGEKLKITVGMNIIVFFLIYILAIPSGILSAAFPSSWADRIITVILFALYSLPVFWAAEVLRSSLSPPFPIEGLHSDNFQKLSPFASFRDLLWHLVLPIACMTYGGLAYISRQMRVGMLEVIRQDYIRTAEAKGASKSRVILVHALRNSLFPVITLFASLLPFLVGGSVIVEFIFNINGMGLWSYDAILRREYDIIMTTLILSAVLTMVGILLSDVLYVIVNPQVSLEGRS